MNQPTPTNAPETAAIVLAAGQGKRMRTSLAKVLHEVGGRPMIDHVLDVLSESGVNRVVVITGHGEAQVKAHLGSRAPCVTQEQQLGTGHAVMQAEASLKGFEGIVMIVCGDTPLWRAETLRETQSLMRDPSISGVVLTMRLDNPKGYGRIVRDAKGDVRKIVEQKDASEDEARICEVNSGAYAFRSHALFAALKRVTNKNAQGEYYLTDVIEILIANGKRILAHGVADAAEAMGVNSRADLALAESAMRERTVRRLMESGVTFIDPQSVFVDPRVQIGEDTIIQPGCILRGKTVIGKECVIGPNSEIVDSKIGDGSKIRHSVIERSEIGPKQVIGPFIHRKLPTPGLTEQKI